MPMLFGSALIFGSFVLVVVVAQVFTLFSSYFPICFVGLEVWRSYLGVRFRC